MDSMFTDAPMSEFLLVSNSEDVARNAVRHAVENDTTVSFLLSPKVTDQLQSEPFTASRMHQLLESSMAEVYHLDAESIDTMAIFDAELRVHAPIPFGQAELPYLGVTDEEVIRAIRASYRSEMASREPEALRFLPTPWQELVAAIESTFGETFLATLESACEAAPVVGTRRDPVAFADLYVLAGALAARTQKELTRFAESHRLISTATVAKTATRLEAADLIIREKAPTDRPGRPPKRFKLIDPSLNPDDFPRVLN